jgi:hypothetical protein
MRQMGDLSLAEELPATEEAAFDTRELGKEERLPGHGNLGEGRISGLPEIQRQDGGAGDVAATVRLTTNAAVERFRPAADIASDHGRPGVAGWTTPQYDIQVPSASPTRIEVNVTMNYDMELASEYTGDVLSVLRDHEGGHVTIGNQTAREHLVEGLETDLEVQSRLTPTRIQSTIQTAANRFTRAEGQDSGDYDTLDYPRMRQAYLGARTPLADLEAASGNIASLASGFRLFNTWAPGANEEQIGRMAQIVLDARDALSEDELSRLQYNAEFRQIIATCRTCIDQIIERFHWDLWIVEFSTLDQSVRDKLDEMRAVLGDFNWTPPV